VVVLLKKSQPDKEPINHQAVISKVLPQVHQSKERQLLERKIALCIKEGIHRLQFFLVAPPTRKLEELLGLIWPQKEYTIKQVRA
jgi:hypothetical protein